MFRMISSALALAVLSIAHAHAQDLDAIEARAEQINRFIALLNHDDASIRLAAFEEGSKSSDPLLKDRAMQAGLESTDPQVRSLAIGQHLSEDPLILFYLPEGVRLTSAQQRIADRDLPLKLDIDTRDFDPSKFSAREGALGYDCQIVAGRVNCSSRNHQIKFAPTAGGSFTGTYDDIPIIYAYK